MVEGVLFFEFKLTKLLGKRRILLFPARIILYRGGNNDN